MLFREHIHEVKRKLSRFPAVAILGPRQCGKTTLAKSIGGRYYDMETEGSRTRLDAEWEAVAAGDQLTIIDEAQESPELFKRLRGTIDQDRKRNGRYLLLGSVSPSRIAAVSQSLAGRIAFVEMSSFSLLEIEASQMDALWLYGAYPDGGILDPGNFPDWQTNYLAALASSDLPKWGLGGSELGGLCHRTDPDGAQHQEPRCDPYYFRSSDGYEIDLLLDWGQERWAVEVRRWRSNAQA